MLLPTPVFQDFIVFLRVNARLALALCLVSLLSVLLSGACSSGSGEPSGSHEADDLALVWEAWHALLDNYADPDGLRQGAVAGGAIDRILELGELEPYPFLSDLGRMRGQVPNSVPVGLTDLWRATQIYRQANPDMDPNELSETLIRGLTDGLPEARASYLTSEQLPEAQERLESSLEGSYLGIGARVVPREGRILLVPFDDSPAKKAGIEPGDVLLAVDGVPVGDATPPEVGDRIKGEEGTKVRLSLQRIDEEDPIELEVYRGNVELPTVSGRLRQGGIGYIRIFEFRDNTGQQVFDLLEELRQYEMLALILDLRSNLGGFEEAAAEIAGQFLPAGDVFRFVEGRDGVRSEHRFSEDRNRLSLEDLLIATLVNGQTVGEAEAVAAALQQAGRATVIGVPTFGEGSGYDFVELSNGSALYIPVSRWYTPNGGWVGNDPVQPDVFVEYEEVPIGPAGEMQFNTAYEFLDSRLPLFR
jgi:carboxyl-terminal processing protease